MSYLVFDIETVPDASLWTPPVVASEPDANAALPGQQSLGLPGAPAPSVPETGTITMTPQATAGFTLVIPPQDAKKARKPRAKKAPTGEAKEPFAPHYAHRVIAIGWVFLDDDVQLKGLGCVGTSSFGPDEAGLLTAWDTFVSRERPTVVTWNGRGFDVPVLGLRALRCGVAQGWASGDYRKRYSDQHVDLFDVFTEFGALPRNGMSLSTMSEVIGLPGKGSVDGTKVRSMFERGEIAKIEAYCASDAARTAFLYLRYRLMRGWLTVDQYRAAARGLLAGCANMQLGPITFGIDSKRLLLDA